MLGLAGPGESSSSSTASIRPNPTGGSTLAVALLVPALAYVLFEGLPYARYRPVFLRCLPGGRSHPAPRRSGLEPISTTDFGGFMLNLVAGLAGIVLSLPIGILLAVGRSFTHARHVRIFCVGFIEIIRRGSADHLLFVAVIILQLFPTRGLAGPARPRHNHDHGLRLRVYGGSHSRRLAGNSERTVRGGPCDGAWVTGR